MSKVRRLLFGTCIFIGTTSLEATCNLCGDHSIPNDGLLQEMNGISCRNLFNELTDLEEGTDDCNRIQLTAFQIGCCDEQYVPENVCTVCPDGSPYRTSIVIPGSPEREELTCADIPSEATFLDYFNNPGDCSDTFLQRSAAWCQCPGHEIECQLCPKGAAPTDLTKMERVLYGWNCQSFQYITALLTAGECDVAQEILEFDAAAYCCEGVEPPDLCAFCPEGQQVVTPNKEVATAYGMVECGDIEESLRFVPSIESCLFLKKSFNSDMCCGVPGSGAVSTNWGRLYMATVAVFTSLFLLA